MRGFESETIGLLPLNRSAGILPSYDGKSPALAKSKQSTHRNPNPLIRPADRMRGAGFMGRGKTRTVSRCALSAGDHLSEALRLRPLDRQLWG